MVLLRRSVRLQELVERCTVGMFGDVCAGWRSLRRRLQGPPPARVRGYLPLNAVCTEESMESLWHDRYVNQRNIGASQQDCLSQYVRAACTAIVRTHARTLRGNRKKETIFP